MRCNFKRHHDVLVLGLKGLESDPNMGYLFVAPSS